MKEEFSTGQAALREADELDRRSALVANLRGAVFIAAAALAVLRWYGKLPSAAWYAVVVCAAAYAGLATFHHVIMRREQRSRLRARLNERGIARLTGEWHRFPERGDRFRQIAHPIHR